MKKLALILSALVASVGLLAVGVVPAQAATLTLGDGYDIAWPQCGRTLPAPGAFSIIDVDGGSVYSSNSCLVSQLQWAKNGSSSIDLYVNTGNPGGPVINHKASNGVVDGTHSISNWPSNPGISGLVSNPRTCIENPSTLTTYEADTVDCAYDYGYRAADSSYKRAVAAFTSAGVGYTAKSVKWWLDLEVANSYGENANTWRDIDPEFSHPNSVNLTSVDLRARNLASLQGQIDYLKNIAGVAQVGLYGAPNDWNIILTQNGALSKDTTTFAGLPFWYPIGSGTHADAVAKCANAANITGSGLPVMVQFIDSASNLDMNVRCNTIYAPPASRVTYTGATSVKRWARMTIGVKLVKSANGVAIAGQRVRIVFNGKTYFGTTNASGAWSTTITAPAKRGIYTIKTFYDGGLFAGSNVFKSVRVR